MKTKTSWKGPVDFRNDADCLYLSHKKLVEQFIHQKKFMIVLKNYKSTSICLHFILDILLSHETYHLI